MKQIFVENKGSRAEAYQRAVEIRNLIPEGLGGVITNHYIYNEETHELVEHFDVNYFEPGEDISIPITPEFIRWLNEVDRKGAYSC